jgi:hypothetical protein
MASRGRLYCVRLWKVDVGVVVVPVSLELLFLLAAGLLGAALLGTALLGAAAATLCSTATLCCFLATFFSCHKLLLLLFSFVLQPQDTVLNFLLWPRVNGAQHVGI